MNSFGDERPSVVAKRPPPPPEIELPSEEFLESLREAARQEGFQQGQEAGYADGLALGRADAAAELVHLQSIALTFGEALSAADETIAADMLDLRCTWRAACCAMRSQSSPS